MPTEPFPLDRREQRRIIAKLYIDLTRVMWGVVKDETVKKGGLDANLLMIINAVMIGHADNKPMNSSKIAHYTGIPRTTVLRRIDDLLAGGMIERLGSSYIVSSRRAKATAQVAVFISLLAGAEKELRDACQKKQAVQNGQRHALQRAT